MTDRSRKRKTEMKPVESPPDPDRYDEDGELLPDEEYAIKRQRNNAAVNKTRQKKRQEEVNTVKRVKQLREENAALERTVESLRHELGLLKEMVLSFASNRSRTDQASSSKATGKKASR